MQEWPLYFDRTFSNAAFRGHRTNSAKLCHMFDIETDFEMMSKISGSLSYNVEAKNCLLWGGLPRYRDLSANIFRQQTSYRRREKILTAQYSLFSKIRWTLVDKWLRVKAVLRWHKHTYVGKETCYRKGQTVHKIRKVASTTLSRNLWTLTCKLLSKVFDPWSQSLPASSHWINWTLPYVRKLIRVENPRTELEGSFL